MMKRAVIILIAGLILSFALILMRWTYHSVYKKDIHPNSEAKILSTIDSRRQTKDTGKSFPSKKNISGQAVPGFFELRAQEIEKFEREYLKRLLSRNNGDVSQAAKEARLPKGTLYRFLKKYNLKPMDFPRRTFKKYGKGS